MGKTGLKLLDSILFFITAIFIITCTGPGDFSGKYKKISGKCKSNYISLKKVRGFGNKYYTVTIYRENMVLKKDEPGKYGWEFLGVINGSTITIYSGTKLKRKSQKVEAVITVTGANLHIAASGKDCTYQRTR
ncbi:hypothetical protein ACFL20_07130 [Spirochaetota bacterium]